MHLYYNISRAHSYGKMCAQGPWHVERIERGGHSVSMTDLCPITRNKILPLNQLPSVKGTVFSMDFSGIARRRMLDLGFVPGTEVEALQKKPERQSHRLSRTHGARRRC